MKDTVIKYLNKEVLLLEKIVKKICDSKEDELFVFSLLSQGIIDSTHTIIQLIINNKLRDSYIISRSIFEHSLNIGYFSVMGKDTIEKAYNHSLSKSYRDLRRKIEIGDIKFSLGLSEDVNIKETKRIKKSISEFTNKKGQEVRAWTGDNTSKKIELINQKYGEGIAFPFTMCLFFIYRHSSEIIHGTIFGALFSIGMTQERKEWPQSDEEYEEYYIHRLTILGQCILLMISSVIFIIGEHIDLGDISTENKSVISEYRKAIGNIDKT